MIRSNSRWLLLLCCCQLFIMLVFINYSAVLPILRLEWGMNNTQAGMIFSTYQLGYIASGVLLSALTDRMNTKLIFTSEAAQPGPRYRLTYIKTGDDTLKMTFEIAPPNDPSKFKTYIEAAARRKAADSRPGTQ